MAIINNKNLLQQQQLQLSQNKTQTAKTVATAKTTTAASVTTIVSNFQNGKISLNEFKNQLTKAGIKYTPTSTTINFTYNGKKYVINSKQVKTTITKKPTTSPNAAITVAPSKIQSVVSQQKNDIQTTISNFANGKITLGVLLQNLKQNGINVTKSLGKYVFTVDGKKHHVKENRKVSSEATTAKQRSADKNYIKDMLVKFEAGNISAQELLEILKEDEIYAVITTGKNGATKVSVTYNGVTHSGTYNPPYSASITKEEILDLFKKYQEGSIKDLRSEVEKLGISLASVCKEVCEFDIDIDESQIMYYSKYSQNGYSVEGKTEFNAKEYFFSTLNAYSHREIKPILRKEFLENYAPMLEMFGYSEDEILEKFDNCFEHARYFAYDSIENRSITKVGNMYKATITGDTFAKYVKDLENNFNIEVQNKLLSEIKTTLNNGIPCISSETLNKYINQFVFGEISADETINILKGYGLDVKKEISGNKVYLEFVVGYSANENTAISNSKYWNKTYRVCADSQFINETKKYASTETSENAITLTPLQIKMYQSSEYFEEYFYEACSYEAYGNNVETFTYSTILVRPNKTIEEFVKKWEMELTSNFDINYNNLPGYNTGSIDSLYYRENYTKVKNTLPPVEKKAMAYLDQNLKVSLKEKFLERYEGPSAVIKISKRDLEKFFEKLWSDCKSVVSNMILEGNPNIVTAEWSTKGKNHSWAQVDPKALVDSFMAQFNKTTRNLSLEIIVETKYDLSKNGVQEALEMSKRSSLSQFELIMEDFITGNKTSEEASEELRKLGASNIGTTTSSGKVSIKFKYNGKNYEIKCDEKAAKSSTDNIKAAVFTNEDLAKYPKNIVLEYFESIMLSELHSGIYRIEKYALKTGKTYKNFLMACSNNLYNDKNISIDTSSLPGYSTGKTDELYYQKNHTKTLDCVVEARDKALEYLDKHVKEKMFESFKDKYFELANVTGTTSFEFMQLFEEIYASARKSVSMDIVKTDYKGDPVYGDSKILTKGYEKPAWKTNYGWARVNATELVNRFVKAFNSQLSTVASKIKNSISQLPSTITGNEPVEFRTQESTAFVQDNMKDLYIANERMSNEAIMNEFVEVMTNSNLVFNFDNLTKLYCEFSGKEEANMGDILVINSLYDTMLKQFSKGSNVEEFEKNNKKTFSELIAENSNPQTKGVGWNAGTTTSITAPLLDALGVIFTLGGPVFGSIATAVMNTLEFIVGIAENKENMTPEVMAELTIDYVIETVIDIVGCATGGSAKFIQANLKKHLKSAIAPFITAQCLTMFGYKQEGENINTQRDQDSLLAAVSENYEGPGTIPGSGIEYEYYIIINYKDHSFVCGEPIITEADGQAANPDGTKKA